MRDDLSKVAGRGLSAARRRAVAVSGERLVSEEPLRDGEALPLVIRPAVEGVNPERWARENRPHIERRLLEHGAVLFRGFDISGAEQFERFVEAVAGDVMEYRERSSPRSQVRGKVYTSTDYPADKRIFLHNEHSYSVTFPLKLFFGCLLAPGQGGETLLADTRRVIRRIDPRIRESFAERKWMYVRNFGDGFGLPWQTVFQTEDRVAVEEYCRRARVECEWKEGNRLKTRQVRPAVAAHPRTGEPLWFNHITFFHVSTLESSVREALLAEFGEEGLPNNTYYGDGSPIEASVMDELRGAYEAESFGLGWEERDLIVLDNILTSHGRAPFYGPRKILFSMAEPYDRDDL